MLPALCLNFIYLNIAIKMTFKELLIDLNACSDARVWAQDKPIEEVVATAPKGEWLLWLAERISVDKKLITLTAGHCANTVRHLMTDTRSTDAVDAAIAFGEGQISQIKLDQFAEAARYARVAKATEATEAARAAWAAWATADAAQMAAEGAAYAAGAAEAARQQNEKQTADICRKYIGNAIIEAVNNKLLTTKK